jgi:hypothetical protein
MGQNPGEGYCVYICPRFSAIQVGQGGPITCRCLPSFSSTSQDPLICHPLSHQCTILRPCPVLTTNNTCESSTCSLDCYTLTGTCNVAQPAGCNREEITFECGACDPVCLTNFYPFSNIQNNSNQFIQPNPMYAALSCCSNCNFPWST